MTKKFFNQERRKIEIRTLFHLLVVLLLISIAGIMVFEGPFYVMVALIFFTGPLLFSGKKEMPLVLESQRATLLPYSKAPHLYSTMDLLSLKAGLKNLPVIYILPSTINNAFSLGTKTCPSLAITQGLLQTLTPRELVSVLAHEVSHLTGHDYQLLKLVRGLHLFSAFLAVITAFFLLLSLPFYFFGTLKIPFLHILIVFISPQIVRLSCLAFLRHREYLADLKASYLTGDPEALAQALSKINLLNFGYLDLIISLRSNQRTSFLDTHPHPQDRIDRLMYFHGQKHLPVS